MITIGAAMMSPALEAVWVKVARGGVPAPLSNINAAPGLAVMVYLWLESVSPMSMYPTVRDTSRFTLRSAVRFRLAKLAPTPAPSGTLPKSHLLGSLQFWVPALSPSHTASPLVIIVFGAWITGPATDSRVAAEGVSQTKSLGSR